MGWCWVGKGGNGFEARLDPRGGEVTRVASVGRGGRGGGDLLRSTLDREAFIDMRRIPFVMLLRRLLGGGDGVIPVCDAE